MGCSTHRPGPAAALGLLLAAAAAGAAPCRAQELAGCPLFPADSIWNVRVDELPVAAGSDAWVETIGAGAGLHPDFGAGDWPPGSGSPIGIPYTTVPASQPAVPVSFDYADESDPGPYPVPPEAPIEGGPESTGDRHVLVVERDGCTLYELFHAFPENGGSSWHAGSGAVFALDSYALRPAGWTSADAAGLPILPGLVRYDEVAGGAIQHALRFTAPRTRREYVWPARHYASSLTGDEYPPMGQRFRLRADFDLSGFSPPVQVILHALKQYGMMLADNGSAWFLSGAPDERWDNELLAELHQVTGADFEAVDVTSLMIDPDSTRTSPAVPCTAPERVTIEDDSITGYRLVEACDEIFAGPNVTVYGPDGEAVLHARNRVVLFDGFAVAVDGRLEAVTGQP